MMNALFSSSLRLLALPALALLSSCQSDGPRGGKNVSLGSALREFRARTLVSGFEADQFYVNLSGDNMETLTKKVSVAESADLSFKVPPGERRQVRVMGMSSLAGSDFVSVSSVSSVSGESALFSVAAGATQDVDLTLVAAQAASWDVHPFIVKAVDASGQPKANAIIAFRRHTDGFVLDNFAKTNASGVAYTRFVKFPWPVDVLVNGAVVAESLDFTQATLTGARYLVNAQAATPFSNGSTQIIATGLFAEAGSGLGSTTQNDLETAIVGGLNPFGGGIPDLNLHTGSNPKLSALALSSGTLSPTFSPTTGSYTVTVPYAVSSLTVTATTAEPQSTLTVNGVAATSGAASASISLTQGSNTITVISTAGNGTTRTYTITVTRSAQSNNANLSALVVTPGVLNPVFSASSTSYVALISELAANFTVTPTVAYSTATVELSFNSGAYQSATSGVASSAFTPTTGANTMDVRVTAENGTTQKTYSVALTYGICGAGLYNDGTNACVEVGLGYWSPAADNSRYACTNKPANSQYTSTSPSTSGCPWSCNSGYLTTDGVSCNAYPNAVVLSCNNNEVAVGLNGRYGAIIDRLGLRCAVYSNNTIVGGARSGPTYGGNGGGPFNDDGSDDCPSQNYLTEVDGYYGIFGGISRTGQLRYRCKSLGSGTTSSWKGGTGGYWGGTGDNGAFNFRCGAGANPYGSIINGIIIDNAGGAAYVSNMLGITCK